MPIAFASLLRATTQPSLLLKTTTGFPFKSGRNTRSHETKKLLQSIISLDAYDLDKDSFLRSLDVLTDNYEKSEKIFKMLYDSFKADEKFWMKYYYYMGFKTNKKIIDYVLSNPKINKKEIMLCILISSGFSIIFSDNDNGIQPSTEDLLFSEITQKTFNKLLNKFSTSEINNLLRKPNIQSMQNRFNPESVAKSIRFIMDQRKLIDKEEIKKEIERTATTKYKKIKIRKI